MYSYDIHDITDHVYKNCRLKWLSRNYLSGFYTAEECKKTGLIQFSFTFCGSGNNPNPNFGHHEEQDILLTDLTASESENGLDVTVVTTVGTFTFHCDGFSSHMATYTGKSYCNIYNKLEIPKISEDWFENEEETQIADDLMIISRYYCDKRYDAEGRMTASHSYSKHRLLKNGIEVHAWVNSDSQVSLKNALILHSNGRRYYAFQVDLYGLCFVDPDSVESYHYVPEGYSHDYRCICGESFIITDIHYDSVSDLCAFDGCYWAGPSEVFVGNLHDPLHYDPHFVRLSEILDTVMEGEDLDCCDIDFVRWEEDALIVSADGTECTFPKAMLISQLKEATSSL